MSNSFDKNGRVSETPEKVINKRKKLGDILISAGFINETQLEEAMLYKDVNKIKLGEALVRLNYVTEKNVINAISMQSDIKKVDLESTYIDPDTARLIPVEIARKYNLIPIEIENGKLIVATSDPFNIFAIDDVRFLTRKQLEVRIATADSINRAIDVYFTKQATDKAIEDLKREYGGDEATSIIDDEAAFDIKNAPAVRLSDSILTQAIALGASDIHIEPFENIVIVRYRIDGALKEVMRIPVNLYSSVCTRLKIIADMDIAERRIPQDGRIEKIVNGKPYDYRVSSLPTIYNEKLVMRILDRSSFSYTRSKLGFTEYENKKIEDLLRMPYGIILLTGPTGSGKTTTLYAFLNELNTSDRNIVTIEDPVEYMLGGINQVQVNTKAGLTFASGLRSILRQDPDIIMIGEIRDEETAQIAVRAAITGHIVLATIHTNDAPGAVTRLVDMGIEPYLVADALAGVIAQRLVRKLCKNCKVERMCNEIEMELLGVHTPVP
ncbi:MAG: epsE, partial [Clostridia bacterium]|nr:epsE [Clostridia bacterium]